ncbi:MAG: winged helix-turn-helix transcriptional regulator [Bacteroidetes bacterium]|nr:winged helix-turn-helix transcriptional regulator [Bacteroidota bacterium]
MSYDLRLKDPEFICTYGWGKVIANLKKQMDQWSVNQLSSRGYKDFKLAYMPVIMNIDLDGTNNNDLAARARVSKQAMSKVIKDLQKKGYITSKTDTKDKRSSIFTLTSRGKDFVKGAKFCVRGLMDEYRKVFGKKEFNELLLKLVEVIEYNDKTFAKDGED